MSSRHPALAQVRAVAGSLARRSARPAVQLLGVATAMVVAANAPAVLLVLAPAVVVWRLRRRRRPSR